MQREIIESAVKGKDTLAILPTGGGKSICFQIPALAKPGIAIVVTPLISLMKDQVQNLKTRGIKALAVYSGMTYHEIDVALDNAISVEAAHHKGITDPNAGHADILLVPAIEVGNVFYKSMVFMARAKNAGVIVGAKAPVVLTSRADSDETKLNSIALALQIAAANK